MPTPIFSLFHKCADTTPDAETPGLGQIAEAIRSDEFLKRLIGELRATSDEASAKALKLHLPAATFSGTFGPTRKNENLLEYSALIVLDFDKLPDAEETRTRVASDPHTACAFISAGGNGVKVVVRVEKGQEQHFEAWKSAVDYYRSNYGLTADPSGKDVSRLCFLSHDPDCHFNPDALPLPVPDKVTALPSEGSAKEKAGRVYQLQKAPPVASDLPEIRIDDARAMLACISSAGRPDYSTWLRLLNSVRDLFGEPDAKALLEEFIPPEKAGEYEYKFSKPTERIGGGTLVHIAKEHGFDWTAHLRARRANGVATADDSEDYVDQPFPVDALPVKVREIAEGLATVHQVPVSMPALAALAVLAGSIGTAVEVDADHRGPTRLNLYVVLGAERGCGKSGVSGDLMRPLQTAAKEQEKQWRAKDPERKATLNLIRGKFLQKKTDTKKFGPVDPFAMPTPEEIAQQTEGMRLIDDLEAELQRQPRLWMGDATSEALARALAMNRETLLSSSADAGDAIRVALGLYRAQGTDVDLYLKAWSGDAHASDRITRESVQLERPCLSLIWFVQGEVLSELTGSREAMERGLIARCLLVDTNARAEETPENPPKLPAEVRQRWTDLVGGFLGIRAHADEGGVVVIEADQKAREVFRQFANEAVSLGRAEYLDVAGELTRWSENSIRVAGIFAVVEEQKILTSDHAARAVEVVRWCGEQSFRLIARARVQRARADADRLEAVIKSEGGQITSGRLQSQHGYAKGQKLEWAKSIVAKFPDRFAPLEAVPSAKNGKGGAPALLFRLRTPNSKSSESIKSPPDPGLTGFAGFTAEGSTAKTN